MDICEAANQLTFLIEGAPRSKSQRRRARDIAKPAKVIIRILRARWRAQCRAILASGAIKRLSEAAPSRKLPEGAHASIRADVAGIAITGRQIELFDDALGDAVDAGAESLAEALGITAARESYSAGYMKNGGFTRVVGDIDITTMDRVQSAVAKSYEAGGTFEDIVQAIKDTFSDMNDYRAEMIAQTELNDAYNQGVLEMGREAGAEGKSWEPDGDPCPICQDNIDQGTIGLEDDFTSGDDAPPAHPNCNCSLEIHAVGADEASDEV